MIASIVLLNFVSPALLVLYEKIGKKCNNNNQPNNTLPKSSDSTNIKSLIKNGNKSEIKRLIKSENTNLGPTLRMINMKGYKEKDLMERREMNKFFIQCLTEISPRAFIWLKQHVDYETCEAMISDWSYKGTLLNIISDKLNSFKGRVQTFMNDTMQRCPDNWIGRQFKNILISKLQTLPMIVPVYLDLILDCILLITIMVVIGPNFKDSQFAMQIAIFLFMSILVPNLITAISIAFRRPYVVMNSDQLFKWRGSTVETATLRFAIIFPFPFVPAMIMISSEKAKEKCQALADKYGKDDTVILASDLEEIELLTKYINECRLAMLIFKRNELSMELTIQLSIQMIMVLLSQTTYPLESGLEAIFNDNNENKERSMSAIIILVLSLIWSFKTAALTAMKIKAEEKNVLPLFPKSLLVIRYLLLFLIRIGSIVTYYSPFLGLCGIIDHYQAEILPLDFEHFMSFSERKYQYWNPIEEEFQSVSISQLFRSHYNYTTSKNNVSTLNEAPTPPSYKLYTGIGLDSAFLIFWAMLVTYSLMLGIMKHFINKDFRTASFAAKLQHIIEALTMPETYSSDWDADHELDEEGHLQNWWRVWREMALMIVMQLISNIMLLVPFFVTGSSFSSLIC